MRQVGSMLVLMLVQMCVYAQGTVQGRITFKNGEPLAGVHVQVIDQSLVAVSNSDGYFVLKNVPAGQHRLVFSSVGLQRAVREVEVGQQPVDITIEMEELIQQLPAVAVASMSLTGGQRNKQLLTGSGFYLSPKQLDAFNYTDINRALRQVPGVYVQEEDGFGLRPNIGLRGSGSSRSARITLMEDGILAAPAPYAAPSAYYFPTIGRMHAVEVLKGSSQIKFGPNTTSGALNLISTPIPDQFSGQLSVLGGSFNTHQLHATVGAGYDNVGFLVETFQYGSDGFKNLDNGGPTGFDKKDFLAKVRFNTNANAPVYQSLLLKAGWATETSNETYLGLTREDFEASPFRRYYGSQEDIMQTDHRQLSARYTAAFSEHLAVHVVGYWNEFARNWYKLDKVQVADSASAVGIGDVLAAPQTYEAAYDALATAEGSDFEESLWVKANNRKYVSRGIQANVKAQFTTGAIAHHLLVGTRIHYDEMDRFQHYDYYTLEAGAMQLTRSGAPGSESNRIEYARALASFAQYSMEWGKVTLTPGLRHEWIRMGRKDYGKNDPNRVGSDLKERENVVNVLIPGIGFRYDINDAWQAFGGIHRGFTPPGNTPDVKPEWSLNYELGARWTQSALSAEVVGFYNDYKNLLGADNAASGGTGTTAMFNGGSAKIFGLEARVSGDVLHGTSTGWQLPLYATYTYTHATFTNSFDSKYDPWGSVENGDFLPYLPQHQWAIGGTLLGPRWEVNMSGQYVAAMRTVAGQAPLDEVFTTDAHFTIDVSASYAVHPRIDLFANAINLTNAIYIAADRPAGVRPGTPRMIMAGVKARF